MWYRYILKPYFISQAGKLLSPLISLPFTVWLEFTGEDIYINNTHKDFVKVAMEQIDFIANKIYTSLIPKAPKVPKKLSMKQLRLRELFKKTKRKFPTEMWKWIEEIEAEQLKLNGHGC